MNKSGPSGFTWKSIRLELAETREFPRGSASRAYMLYLPLRPDGTIDEAVLRANPNIAGFRRFWPNEADRVGRVERTESGWALSFQPAPEAGSVSLPIEMNRLLPGDQVTIEKQGQRAWRFRVVDLSLGFDTRS
ncbi:hypothetical protein [Novosphingobium sp. CF614]|uniref:hypothetical protein n=1 Tax=Novosphingobium sp. CF614 TaxID=1884364 RepID=UPI000B81140F|nr:hypothetical protein [Novosphingobium sp. CF614]